MNLKSKLKPLLLMLCCLSFVATAAAAQSAPTESVPSTSPGPGAPADAAKLPFCSLTADGTRLAVEPCRKAPQKVPRRSVAQVIAHMPHQKTLSYTQPYTQPSAPPPALTRPATSPAVSINSCSPAGCRDASGVLHPAGAGSTFVDQNGKLCSQHGVILQCF